MDMSSWVLPICKYTQPQGCLSRSYINSILSLGNEQVGLPEQGNLLEDNPSRLDRYPFAKGKTLDRNITPALKWKGSFGPQGAAPGFSVLRDPRDSVLILYQKHSQGKILP